MPVVTKIIPTITTTKEPRANIAKEATAIAAKRLTRQKKHTDATALTWTRARPAGYVDADSRITVKGIDATVAIVPGGVVSATDASTGLGIAAVRVSVALAALAVRKVPETGFALATGSAVGVTATLATTSFNVAKVVESTDPVAIARYAAFGTESVRARCATIATSADHVRLAGAHSAVIFAKETARSRRIALTG